MPAIKKPGPHCGFDNRAGSGFGFYGSRIGEARSVEAAELRRMSNQ